MVERGGELCLKICCYLWICCCVLIYCVLFYCIYYVCCSCSCWCVLICKGLKNEEVKGSRVGLNLCSKTVSWVDVLFAYSCTATDMFRPNKPEQSYHQGAISLQTPEDISHLLANSTVMTVLDCKKGYWHQELDEASSYLTTFNTEFGRYCYTVMPFGATVMDDVFSEKTRPMFWTLTKYHYHCR